MAATLYSRYRGETITIAVADSGAQPGGEALIASSLRPIRPGHSAPLPGTPDAADMAIGFRTGSDGFPAGWLLTLAANDCAALTAGTYLIDLRIADGAGGVTITQPALVLLAEPATL